MAAEQTCYYEQRFSHLEQEVAELKARMNNKRENIDVINNELSQERQHQIELIEKVAEVTVLLKEGQKQREANNKRFDTLETKVDKLQDELTDLHSSQRSFRNTILALIPIISIIVGIILHYI
jgi:chromosome segregation ATPase